MNVTEPIKNVYLVQATDSKVLAKTFIRFQEFYESPKFSGQSFKLADFKKWYNKGNFTYYSDWTGFNIPGSVLEHFRSGKMNPLRKCEKDLLEKIPRNSEKYYVIGASVGDETVLKHELSHAKFYSSDSYKHSVLNVLEKNKSLFSKLEKHLLSIGYAKFVILDEIHAYILSEKEYLQSNNIWSPKFENIRLALEELYNG